MPSTPTVVGRFAPSPSGPRHAGSLLAAIGSALSVRSQGGRWLLRLEDVDAGRVRPGAAGAILRQLEALALDWDGPVLTQAARKERYQDALKALQEQGAAYPCACTRQDIRGFGARYPGTCRQGLAHGRQPRSWRLRVPDTLPPWEDRFHGRQDTPAPQGDPVLLRADGYFAYILVCVVDDGAQGVSEVIRGGDLLSITGVQRHLQNALNLPHPQYGHLPLLRNAEGRKLSKSADSPAWTGDPSHAWEETLRALGWTTPAGLRGASAGTWRDWALARMAEGQPLYRVSADATGPRRRTALS